MVYFVPSLTATNPLFEYSGSLVCYCIVLERVLLDGVLQLVLVSQ